MYICRNCGCEVNEVMILGKEIISKLNKEGEAIKKIYEDEKPYDLGVSYRCDGCRNESFYLEEIAEWEEE